LLLYFIACVDQIKKEGKYDKKDDDDDDDDDCRTQNEVSSYLEFLTKDKDKKKPSSEPLYFKLL
jgi:hypothetical protein